MSARRDLRHGLRIGRAEFVRSARRYVGERRRLIGLGFVLLFFGGNLLLSLPTAYAVGRTAESLAAVPYFEPAATVVPVGLVGIAALRTLERIGGSDEEALLLTTVHPRAAVLGLVLSEVGRLAAWFGLPLAAVLVAFALGLGSPTLPLVVALVAVPMVCWAAVWGYAAGLALLRVVRWLPGAGRVLTAGGVLGMLALIVGSQFVGRYVVETERSLRALAGTLTVAPVADYVALAFVGTRLGVPPAPGAVAVLGLLVATTPAGVAVATRQATRLWFTDAPVREDASEGASSLGDVAAPAPFAWAKAGRVAWGLLVRGVRNPAEFGHLVMVLFFAGPLATTLVRSSGDALGVLVAATGVGLGTYLSGATFGLNPLGDDRTQAPLLLLTPTAPRAFVRGRVLAGLAVGLPVAVLVALASVLLGTGPADAVAFAAVGVGTSVAAALFAVGLGAAYPIYEEREFWGTETVVPSTLVMMVYVFVVGGGTVVALVLTWFGVAGALSVTPVVVGGVTLYLLVTLGVSCGSYRYAVRRYRRYTLD
jgi:ABC-2 type transport system permease protein